MSKRRRQSSESELEFHTNVWVLKLERAGGEEVSNDLADQVADAMIRVLDKIKLRLSRPRANTCLEYGRLTCGRPSAN